MSVIVRNRFQLLGVVDPRLGTSDALWAAQSSYTQQGPHPGNAVPDVATPLVLETSGDQAAGGSLTIQCVHPGSPGIEYSSAEYAWKQTADSLYKGRIGPHMITGWESLFWTDGTATTVYTKDPHMLGLADGTVVQVYESQLDAGLAPYGVRARVRATNGTWAAQASLKTQAAAPTNVFSPCLVELPDGTLVCYYWLDLDLDGDGTVDTFQIGAVQSQDGGATWANYTQAVLEDAILASAYVPGRIRGAALNGQVLLVFELRAAADPGSALESWDVLREVASRDRGFSFKTVRTAGTTFDPFGTDISSGQGRYPEVVVFGDAFHVFHLGIESTPKVYAYHHTTGSAFSSALNAGGERVPNSTGLDFAPATVDTTSYKVGDGDLTVAVSEEGIVTGYVSVYAAGAGVGQKRVFESRDAGLTWNTGDNNSGLWWNTADAATTPRNIAACYQRGKGRVLIAHNWDANPGNEDDSLAVAYLGGPSSITPPHYRQQQGSQFQAGWTRTWLPFDLPGDCGWTAAGAGTEALTAGALNLSTTGAQALTYTRTPTGSIIEGISLEAQVTVNSGGSIIATTTAFQVRIADGTDDYDITFRLGGTNCRIIDNNNAGATVGSDVAIDTSLGVRVKIELAELDGVGTVRSWVRAAGAEELEWTTGPTGTVTDDVATPNANHTLVWGHVVAGAANSDWTEVHIASDEDAAGTLAGGFTNPDDLDGTPYATTPVGVDGATKITAKAGSIALDVQHVITPRYDYSIERLFSTAYPSPRQGWRSVDTSTNEEIALAYDETLLGTAESSPGNDILVWAFRGINWRTATLARYDVGTAAWVTVHSLDAADGMDSMAYARTGATIRPGASSQTPYLHTNECAGWWVDLGGGKLRKVKSNTEGSWDSTFNGKRATLILEGVDGTEGATGTLALVSNNIAAVVNMLGETASGWRLRIATQSNVDGYFAIGCIDPCIGVAFGDEMAWGRSIDVETNVETTMGAHWRRRSRKLSPRRRVVDFGWADGIDEHAASSYGTTLGDTNPTPDWIVGSATAGAEAIASQGDTSRKLDGLLSMHEGSRIPVVVIPYVPKGPVGGVNVFTLNRRDQFIVGSGPDQVSIDTVVGTENVDEVVRIASYSVTEDV